MKKRTIWYLLAILCVTIFSMSVCASASSTEVEWSLDESGTLYITGEGATPEAAMREWRGNRFIRHVVIGDGITAIGDEAFRGCDNLRTIEIPDSVTTIGEEAFLGTDLEDIQLHDGITSIGENAFEKTPLKRIVIPKGVTVLSSGLFCQCDKLIEVILHDKVEEIESYVFYDCDSLTHLDIPDSVTRLRNAFWHCDSLTTVTLGRGLKYIPTACFRDCVSLKQIDIPDSVEDIYQWAFENCTSLERVNIGSGLLYLDDSAFNGCSGIKSFHVDEKNTAFSDIDGVLCNKDGTVLLMIPKGFTGTYQVPSSIVSIKSYAGSGCHGLTELIIPANVETIYLHAFENCSALQTLTLTEGIRIIRSEAFASCKSLKKLTIPATMEQIEGLAFAYCEGLETIEFLGKLPYVGDNAFFEVEADAYYPEGDPSWEDGRQDYSGKLTWVQDPQFDEYSGMWGKNILWTVDPQTWVLTLTGQGAMKEDTFYPWGMMYGTMIKSLMIGDGITSISFGAFDGLSELTSVTIPASVTVIGRSAFAFCEKLEHIELHDGITEIGEYAFRNCRSLKDIVIPSGVEEIGWGAFSDCIALQSITFPDGIKEIATYGFDSCKSLRSVTIPASMTTLGDWAFGQCSSLEQIIFLGGPPHIENMAFEDVKAYVYHPEGSGWDGVAKGVEADLVWRTYCQGDHTWIKMEAVAPTCTSKGATEGTCCEKCGLRRVLPDEIPFAPHSFGPWIVASPDTVEAEYRLANRCCSICGYKETKYAKDLTAEELEQESPTADSEPSGGKNTWWIVVISVAVLIGGGVVIAVFWSKRRSKTE